MNLKGLSEELGIINQQCTRHLSRLIETGLAEKDPEGLYHISPYGARARSKNCFKKEMMVRAAF